MKNITGCSKGRINNRATNIDSGARCKTLQVLQGSRGPPAPGAETRQCTDQVEPVRGVRSRAVKGRVRPGRRVRLRLRWRPSGPPAREDLPLGDPAHRSPSSQYPAPVGGVWVPCAGTDRGLGQQTGLLALLAPLARLALTTDSVLGPQRSGRAHCARLVAPSRSRPGDRPRLGESVTHPITTFINRSLSGLSSSTHTTVSTGFSAK